MKKKLYILNYNKHYIISFFSSLLLVFFLYSGRMKNTEISNSFDVTILSSALLLIHLIFLCLTHKNIKINKKDMYALLVFFLFCLWLFVSMIWSPSKIYSISKAIFFPILSLFGIVYALLISSIYNSTRKHITISTIILCIFFSIPVIFSFFSNPTASVIGIFGNRQGYLGLSRLVGIGLVIIAYRSLSFKSKYILSLIPLLFFFFLLFVIGGRMPFISSIIIILLILFENTKFRKYYIKFYGNIKYFYIILLLSFAFIPFFVELFSNSITISRILIIFSDHGDSSIFTRFEHYIKAWSLFLQRPFIGFGIGSFGILSNTGDVRYYPHNIFLEILVENGFIGLILLLFLFFYCTLRIFYYGHTKDEYFYILVYLLLNALVSGDLNDNRLLFFYLILAGGYKNESSSYNDCSSPKRH